MKYKKTSSGVEYVSFDDWKKECMRNPEFKKAYEARMPEFALRRAMLDARLKKGMTQKQIAERAGTTQSAIARFEAGGANPTLDLMTRISEALGMRLEIRLIAQR